MIWMLLCVAFGQSVDEVEAALNEAENHPSEQTCGQARHVSNAYRRNSDGDTLARMLETYALELWYPYSDSEFSVSFYTASFERDAGKNKKHPMADRSTCLMRDILYTEGRDVPVERMSKFAKKIKANCGPLRRVEKARPSPQDLLVRSVESRREYVNAPGGSPELTAMDAKAVEDTAKAFEEIRASTDALAAARQEHDTAKAALLDAMKHMPTAADCQGEHRKALDRVATCTEWVVLNPQDAMALLYLITAHTELAHAGIDSSHHATIGIARLRQLRSMLPEGARGDADKAIEALEPLVRR